MKLADELGLFIERFGWSRHLVTIGVGTSKLVAIRTWCDENIGPQLPAMVDATIYDRNIDRFFWLGAVEEGSLNPVTFAFRRDEDAVHFKLRWFDDE